jgi:hypothetical protein
MNIFDNTKAYEVGDKVFYNDKVYEALATISEGSNTPDISYDWIETYVNVSEAVVKPYIESVNSGIIKTNTTKNIVLYGSNFDDNMTVSSPDIPDENITIISVKPTEMVIAITAGSTEVDTTFNVYKSGVKNFGITPKLIISSTIIGDGPSGTFETVFTNNSGTRLWGREWKLEIFGSVNSIDSYFRSSKSNTPSGGTGPNNSIDGSYYAFCEASNPNNGGGQYGTASTRYFKGIQSIEFDYHMYGAGMGALTVQGFDGAVWSDLLVLDGQQQATQSEAWKHTKIDCSNLEEIRFCFNYAKYSTAYTADICIDNLKITSV